MLTVERVAKRFALEAGYFARAERYVQAVGDVSFTLAPGQTYGLVGESGSGKTTTARLAIGMYRPDAGRITYRDRDGREYDIGRAAGGSRHGIRDRLGYVFQDPAKSLNPRATVRRLLLSGYRYSPRWPGTEAANVQAVEALQAVGLGAGDLERRPPDFSGGQRQRIAIARALIVSPELLICDEIVSALDVSIQSQILDLLQRLRSELQLTLLFISHDLAVVTYFCDRVGVMYRGYLVEEAPAQELAAAPVHPYTRRLYAAVPKLAAGDELPPTVPPPPPRPPLPPSAPEAGGLDTGTGAPATPAPVAVAAPPGIADPMQEVSPGHRVSRRFWHQFPGQPGQPGQP